MCVCVCVCVCECMCVCACVRACVRACVYFLFSSDPITRANGQMQITIAWRCCAQQDNLTTAFLPVILPRSQLSTEAPHARTLTSTRAGLCCGIFCRRAYFVAGDSTNRQRKNKNKKISVDDDDDDVNIVMIIIILIKKKKLDLIFVKVQSSLQLLSEIYGYLFQHVKENVHGTEQPKYLC